MADQMTEPIPGPQGKPIVRYLAIAARLLMGLLFVVMGLNGFFNFIPKPPEPMPAGAEAFVGALLQTHYMLPLIMGTQVVVGLLLLVNRLAPLALVLIAPVVVNIVAFHAFLAPSGLVIAIIVLALECYLVWAYRKAYGPMFALRATPGAK